jgi:hypothetical protein
MWATESTAKQAIKIFFFQNASEQLYGFHYEHWYYRYYMKNAPPETCSHSTSKETPHPELKGSLTCLQQPRKEAILV